MLYHSAEIFDGAQYLYSTPDYNGDPNIYRWNYFYTPVQIGEKIVGVRIAVKDLVEGTNNLPESQIYNWGIKRGASVDGGSPGQSPLSSGVSLDAPGKPVSLDGEGGGISRKSHSVSSDVPSMDSIPQTAQNVNSELAQQAEKTEQAGISPATTQSPAGTLLAEAYDLARRMGACGQKGLSEALGVRKLGGGFNETDFLIGYIDVYLAALNGVPHGPAYLPATVDSHARRLSLVERMQAYHNGLNDAKARTQAAQSVNPETGIPQAAAQGDKTEIFGEDGADLIEKSAGEVELAKPGEPVQIGTVDFADKKTVLALLDSAQKVTADLDYEVNYSVTTDGKVWRVLGGSGTVDPTDIPSSLVGSYAYHNHPRAKTWGSFSAYDVRLFFSSGEYFSKASDHLYEYIMERTKDTVAIDPEEVYHRFEEIETTIVGKMKWDRLIDPDLDGYHETMKILSQELRFHYERKSRSK